MTDLYISSKKLDCHTVVSLLLKFKINGWVHPNQTVRCDKNLNCWTENGCHIKLVDELPKKKIVLAWNKLKNNLPIDCAYIRTHNFKGCILDFVRESECNKKNTN